MFTVKSFSSRGAKSIKWGNDHLFISDAETTGCPHAKELCWNHISHHTQKLTQNGL